MHEKRGVDNHDKCALCAMSPIEMINASQDACCLLCKLFSYMREARGEDERGALERGPQSTPRANPRDSLNPTPTGPKPQISSTYRLYDNGSETRFNSSHLARVIQLRSSSQMLILWYAANNVRGALLANAALSGAYRTAEQAPLLGCRGSSQSNHQRQPLEPIKIALHARTLVDSADFGVALGLQ